MSLNRNPINSQTENAWPELTDQELQQIVASLYYGSSLDDNNLNETIVLFLLYDKDLDSLMRYIEGKGIEESQKELYKKTFPYLQTAMREKLNSISSHDTLTTFINFILPDFILSEVEIQAIRSVNYEDLRYGMIQTIIDKHHAVRLPQIEKFKLEIYQTDETSQTDETNLINELYKNINLIIDAIIRVHGKRDPDFNIKFLFEIIKKTQDSSNVQIREYTASNTFKLDILRASLGKSDFFTRKKKIKKKFAKATFLSIYPA